MIFVPTICLVEIIYLQEKGRIPAEMKRLLDKELTSGSVGIFLSDLTGKVVEMLSRVPRSDVPDMPDRIIAATAFISGFPDQSRSQDSTLNRAYNLVNSGTMHSSNSFLHSDDKMILFGANSRTTMEKAHPAGL